MNTLSHHQNHKRPRKRCQPRQLDLLIDLDLSATGALDDDRVIAAEPIAEPELLDDITYSMQPISEAHR